MESLCEALQVEPSEFFSNKHFSCGIVARDMGNLVSAHIALDPFIIVAKYVSTQLTVLNVWKYTILCISYIHNEVQP